VSKNQDKTDQELIDACRAGRQGAWQEVLDRYERLVFSIPLNFGLTRADAADVAQLTFTTLVEHLDRLRPDSNLGGWLATVARRHALRLLRKQKREFLGQDEDIGDSPLLASIPINDPSAWERVEWLNQGLSRLDQRCQKLLLRLYLSDDQPAYEVVAAELGLRVGSIGPIRGRCLERLRAILLEPGA
jgi:RNA polymerase sigma factor (sigma-70 family)